MLSRILWVGVAGLAIIAGMAFQGDRVISWDDHSDSKREQTIEAKVDRAIDRSFDKMQVMGPDGEEVDVPAETKRELAGAVGRLVKAETDLAMLKMSDSSDEEMDAARDKIADARADIDRLKVEIKSAESGARLESDALRDQIREEVRESVRESVGDATRN